VGIKTPPCDIFNICTGRYLYGNQPVDHMESTPGTKVKDTQKSVSFLVSNSNPLTLESVTKSEERVTRYPLAIVPEDIGRMKVVACFRIHATE